MEKSVLMSIQPKWCERIANGNKTIEVRKTEPKLDKPFKVYIYCTKNKRQWLRKVSNFVREIFITENIDVLGRTDKVNSLIGDWTTFIENGGYNGKVIGEFLCECISEWHIDPQTKYYFITPEELTATCLTYEQLDNYGDGKTLYGWHISNLVIYDKPVELYKFHRECERPECEDCSFFHFENTPNSYEGWCECDEKISIKRPPQSWCYVSDTGINTSKGEN